MVCFQHCRWCAVEDCALRITDEVVCDHYKPKPQTNHDVLVSMSPEKLAWFIEREPYRPWCTPPHERCRYSFGDKRYGECDKCALDWLKQEAVE